MTDMTIKMTLAFVDTASAGLRQISTLVESLGPKITGLANRLTTLERNLNKVGTAADGAVGKLSKAEASVDKLVASSSKLESILAGLPGVVAGMTAALQSASSAITQAVNSLSGLSAASQSASGNVKGATANLNQMGNVVSNVTKQVITLHGVMEGLAARWVSMKIFEAGGAVVEEAGQFEQTEKKLQGLNYPTGQFELIKSDAIEMAKKLNISVRESLEAYSSAIAGLAVTDYSESRRTIQETLDTAVKTAILLRLRGDRSTIQDLTRNLYGLVEARGQVNDPEGALRTMNLVEQNNLATMGKLTTKDLETVFRQLKGGLGALINDDGMIRVLAYANQLKASGLGGGGGGMGVSQAGTMATQVAKWGSKGVQNKDSIRLLEAMGLVDRDVARNDSSTTEDNLPASAIKGSSQAAKDPIKYFMDMAPYVLALAMKNKDVFAPGMDVTSEEGMKVAFKVIAEGLFKNINVSNAAVQAWLPGTATRINQELVQTKQAKQTEDAFKDVDATYLRNIEKFTASVKTLEVALGGTLLPMLTPVVEGLTAIVNALTGVTNSHPAAAVLTEIALGIAGVALAIFSLQKMFGVFSILSKLLTGLTGGVVAAGAASQAAGEAFGGFGTVLSRVGGWVGDALKWLGRGAGIVGALILLYDTLLFVFDVKIWGVSIGTWFASFADNMMTKIGNLKDSIKELFGLMTKAEAEKSRKERTQAHEDANKANGIGTAEEEAAARNKTDTGIKKITGPDGKPWVNEKAPGGERPKTKEDIAREKLIEDAKKINTGVYDPNLKAKGYNVAAGLEQQKARVEEAALQADIKILDAYKKAQLISDENYYNAKEAVINYHYDRIIADIEAKKSKLRPNEQHARQIADADIKIANERRSAAIAKERGDKEKAELDYKAGMSRVQSILDEVEGKRGESRLERLKQELVTRRAIVALNGTPEELAKVDKGIKEVDAGIEFERVYDTYQRINDTVNRQFEIIDSKVKAGLMTETEAAQKKYLLRKEESEQLEGIIQQLEVLAAAKGDDDLVQKIQMLKIQLQGYAKGLSPMALETKHIMESSFAGFFTDLTNKNKTLKQSFDDLWKGIHQGITQLIAKQLSEQLWKSLFGNGTMGGNMMDSFFNMLGMGSGSSGGGGGFMGFLGGMGSSLFGGGEEFADMSTAMAFSSGGGLGGAASLLGSFDVGTNAVPFDMIAKIHKDEIIVPAADSKEAAARLRGDGASTPAEMLARAQPSLKMEVNINSPDYKSFRENKGEVLAAVHAASLRALQRNR